MVGTTYTATSATNTAIWTLWNSVTTSTTATIDVWPAWNTQGTTAATTSFTNTAIWTVWNQTHATTTVTGSPYVPRKKTDAEVQAELKRAEEYKRQEEERRARELVAKQRAEKLLLEALSPEQREDLVKKKCFYLHLANGKKYRIDRSTHGNVYLMDDQDRLVRKFCAQPSGVPVDDAVLAQKLALENDEESFLRVANATNLR